MIQPGQHNRSRSLSTLAAHSNAKGDPRQNSAGAASRAATPDQALRAAASNHSHKTPPRMKSEPGPPATLGSSAAAGVRFIVWCKDCSHQVEPDPVEQAQRHGAAATAIDWHQRLICSKCGSHEIDMVVTGTKRHADN